MACMSNHACNTYMEYTTTCIGYTRTSEPEPMQMQTFIYYNYKL